MCRVRVLTWLLLMLCSHIVFAENNHKFYDEPEWIKLKNPDIQRSVPVDRVKDGTHYLLVDNQIQVTKAGTAPVTWNANISFLCGNVITGGGSGNTSEGQGVSTP